MTKIKMKGVFIMNIKLTKKQLMKTYRNVICVGYCDLQYLLNYANKIGHTERVEGWAADIYEINYKTIIVTGYAPFGNIRPDYKLTDQYEEKALKLCCKTSSGDKLKIKLDKLLQEYVSKVLESEVQ